MTLLTLQSNPTGKQHPYWTVSRHSLNGSVIYLSVDKFDKVMEMNSARHNTAWMALVAKHPGLSVTIDILMLTDTKPKAEQWRADHMAVTTKPYCNEHGIEDRVYKRIIQCSDGRWFQTQKQAAAELGVSQPTVCQHLQGHTPTVAGVKLWKGDMSKSPAPASASMPTPPPPRATPEQIAARGYPDYDEAWMAAYKAKPSYEGTEMLPPPGWNKTQWNYHLRDLGIQRNAVAAMPATMPAQPGEIILPDGTRVPPPTPEMIEAARAHYEKWGNNNDG